VSWFGREESWTPSSQVAIVFKVSALERPLIIETIMQALQNEKISPRGPNYGVLCSALLA